MTDSSGHRASAAWKAWIESDEGKQCADASTLTDDVETYLRNRLWHAFMAGVDADTQPSEQAKSQECCDDRA